MKYCVDGSRFHSTFSDILNLEQEWNYGKYSKEQTKSIMILLTKVEFLKKDQQQLTEVFSFVMSWNFYKIHELLFCCTQRTSDPTKPPKFHCPGSDRCPRTNDLNGKVHILIKLNQYMITFLLLKGLGLLIYYLAYNQV